MTVMSSHSASLTSQQTTGCNLRAKSVSMKVRVNTTLEDIYDCSSLRGRIWCVLFSPSEVQKETKNCVFPNRIKLIPFINWWSIYGGRVTPNDSHPPPPEQLGLVGKIRRAGSRKLPWGVGGGLETPVSRSFRFPFNTRRSFTWPGKAGLS